MFAKTFWLQGFIPLLLLSSVAKKLGDSGAIFINLIALVLACYVIKKLWEMKKEADPTNTTTSKVLQWIGVGFIGLIGLIKLLTILL